MFLNAGEESGMVLSRRFVAASSPMIGRGGVWPHYAWTVLVLSHSSVDGRLLIRSLRLFALELGASHRVEIQVFRVRLLWTGAVSSRVRRGRS